MLSLSLSLFRLRLGAVTHIAGSLQYLGGSELVERDIGLILMGSV
jgi:hypothetical protein